MSCTVHCSVPSRCLADFVELPILASAHGVAVAVAAAVDASAVAVPVAAVVAVAAVAGAVAAVAVAVVVSRTSDFLGLHPTQDDSFRPRFHQENLLQDL